MAPELPFVSVVKAFGISPLGFPNDDSMTPQFYAELQGIPEGGVFWNGLWRDDAEDGTDAGTMPVAAVATQQSANAFDIHAMVAFGWRSGTTLYLKVPGNPVNNWTNTDARELFTQMLIEYVVTQRPKYIFLGNENDFYFEQSPLDYLNWIEFYENAYDTIKATLPTVLVGPIFNFEHLAGAGALAGWTTPRWGALTAHTLNKIDVVGLTVYPWLNYASPGSVPPEYLNPLVVRIGFKPIAITETGWPAENLDGLIPAWATSDSSQVEYLASLKEFVKGKQIETLNWLFLNPMASPDMSPVDWRLFGSVSIRDTSGVKREVYDEWVNYFP